MKCYDTHAAGLVAEGIPLFKNKLEHSKPNNIRAYLAAALIF